MSEQPGNLTAQQQKLLKQLTASLTRDQLTWLGGYFTALGKQKQSAEQQPKTEWKLFYASMSGNAEWVAEEAVRLFTAENIPLEVVDLRDYQPAQLIQETKALFVISTHGEGDPPYAAEHFYEYIHHHNPDLRHLQYSLLALGDSSYLKFCQAGRDIDKRLEELGGLRFYPRTDCDQEYEEPASTWLNGIIEHIKGKSD